ncbi:MAG: RNA polymerase sigma factor, partial [Chloroflexi bacterium]|nr:RNA polymerase sigma factor [Chloroflexota bacterium]
FALRFMGNPDDADDAAQETLIQVYQALPVSRLDFAFRPWLYRVARNKCIDMLRRKRSLTFSALHGDDDDFDSIEGSIPDTDPLPDQLAERADLQRILHEAINTLPLKYRTVVTLRYVADLTFGEIGESLGLPENTVKTHFQRAKGMLRAKLQELAPRHE